MDYRYGSLTVYNIEYHFVWVTKYPYKVLTGDVALRAENSMGSETFDKQTSPKWSCQEVIFWTLLGFGPTS